MSRVRISFAVVLFFVLVMEQVTCRTVILSEQTLKGTCTGQCAGIELGGKLGCKRITSCSLNSAGPWTLSGRCDKCSCNCEDDVDQKDILVTRSLKTFNEETLYGTCMGKCPKSGLVRTDFQGCSRIEDCQFERKGWQKFLVMCNYCKCTCVVEKYPTKYKMENVKYQGDKTTTKKEEPIAVAETTMENGSGREQRMERTLTYSSTTTTWVATSHGLRYDTTVNVGGSIGLGLSVSTSVAHTLSMGYSYTAGKNDIKSKQDSIKAAAVVPKFSTMNVTILGQMVKVHIPFTADMVTTYNDGTAKTTRINGTYNEVEMSHFKVQLHKPRPMPGVGSGTTPPPTVGVSQAPTATPTHVTHPQTNTPGKSKVVVGDTASNLRTDSIMTWVVVVFSVFDFDQLARQF